MNRRLGAVAVLLASTAPASWAAKVYVPYAVHQEDRGVSQRTEIYLTNGQPNLAQAVRYRLLGDDASAGSRALGGVDLRGGQSLRIVAPVAAGGRGLLEIDAPAGVAVGARLVVARPGADAVESAVPVLDARSAFASGAQITLQGLKRSDEMSRSALGVVNLGGRTATCEVSVADALGRPAFAGSLSFALAPRTQALQDDLFDLFGAELPDEAVASVTCSESFWAFAVVSDEVTGAARFVEPAFQTMVEPAATSGSTVFSLPGLFLTSSKYNHNWQYDMRFPTTLTFRKVVVDFDVFVKGWDPANPGGYHCLFWLNNGRRYANMMGYMNTIGTKNRTRLEVNYGGQLANAAPIGMKPGNTYHVHFEHDLITKTVWYRITQGSNLVVSRSYPRTASSFNTSYHFIQFGTQIAPEGPEAKTYGWKFSNFRGEFVP